MKNFPFDPLIRTVDGTARVVELHEVFPTNIKLNHIYKLIIITMI